MVNDIDLYCFVTEDLNFSDYKKFLKDGSDLSVENLKDFKFYNNFIDEHSQIARYYREKVKEIQNAIKINKCLFYVKDEDTFFFNGKKADINGKVILLRCTIQDTYLVLNKIKQNGGISLSSIEDCEKIFDWIKYYKTDRRIYKMTFKQFKDNHEKLLKFFNGNMFFKTRVNWWF